MDPNSERIIELFSQAMAKPAEARAVFLAEACRDEPRVHQQVESLLRAAEPAREFLKQPLPQLVPAPDLPAEKPGDQIGRYKLREKIGEGGCGVVYVADQEQPLRRRVALKVIKLGMDTRQVIARFEAERQALALMDHPNIAKVLDAGATDTGRPYFVMELVRGLKLTDYCDQTQCTTRQRLDLFMQVCKAIQHAHQKGIIHRDIKPSNILVTLHDGVPVPKVIDFGIAKATEGRLTEQTVYTALHEFIGTPAYISPEQAEMSGLDMDTRSDIYSLGVLLYELLTGKTPFDAADLVKAGLDGLRRTIREREPLRPSTKLGTLQGAELTTTARQRGVGAPELVHAIRGDLDWIAMKCLEKDRARRYETANGLARDVERHLNNEPVVARPPSRLYELQKTVRRHWVGFAAAAALLVVLTTGVVLSSLQAIRARRAEALAQERLAESEAVSKFLTQVFQSPDPRRDGRTVTVAESLAGATRKLERELSTQPMLRAKLQATLALTYYALGLYRDAIPLQEKVRHYCLATFGPEAPETLRVMQDLANSYDRADRRLEALRLRERVLALRQRLIGPEHPDTLTAMLDLGSSYTYAGRSEALTVLQLGTNAAKAVSQAAAFSFAYEYGNWPSKNATGFSHASTLVREGIRLMETSLALRRKVSGPDHPDTLEAMQSLAAAYAWAGQADQAVKLFEEVLARRRSGGPERPETLEAMDFLAECYRRLGRIDESIKLGEEALSLCRKVFGPEHPETLSILSQLGWAYESIGRMDDAITYYEQALLLRRKVSSTGDNTTRQAMVDLANCYATVGRGRESITLMRELCELNQDSMGRLRLAVWQAWFGPDAEYEATRRRILDQAQATDDVPTADRAAKAYCLRPSTDAAMLRKALELARKAAGREKGNPWLQLGLGLAEYRNGLYAAAEQSLTAAERTAGTFHDLAGTARCFRVMTLVRLGRVEEARLLFRQAESQLPPPPSEGKPFTDAKSHDSLIWRMAAKEAKAELQIP